jgi:hypothetical protein
MMKHDKKEHRKVEGSMKKVILSMIVLVAVFSIAQAAPFQTLGMLRTPDAYVLPHKAAEFLLVGYYRDVAKPTPPADRKSDYEGFAPYGMIGVGILDRVELGVFAGDYTKTDGMVYFFNAKVKIIEETLRIPQIAIGMDNILSPVPKHKMQWLTSGDAFYSHPDRDAYEPYSPYLVGSKQAVFMGIPWMLNLGVGSNRFVGQAARSRFFNGVFTSLEMAPMKDLSLQFEYDGEDFNAGVKYSYKNFGIKLAGAAMEDLAKNNGYQDNLRVALGLSYLFDKYAEAKRRPDIGRYASENLLEGSEMVEVGETEVSPSETGTGVPGGPEVVVVPGTQLQTPGLVTQSGEGYKELSPEVRDLLEELRVLREERQKAQQAMDDLRKWIQELKKPKE